MHVYFYTNVLVNGFSSANKNMLTSLLYSDTISLVNYSQIHRRRIVSMLSKDNFLMERERCWLSPDFCGMHQLSDSSITLYQRKFMTIPSAECELTEGISSRRSHIIVYTQLTVECTGKFLQMFSTSITHSSN